MKRYGKILAVCLATLLTIGTFYIQSSLAGNKDIEIEFETVRGDDQELNKITLYGDYIRNNNYYHLVITKEETVNLNRGSLFQRFIKLSTGPRIKELISQYRSFMRGNELNENFYFQDEKYLVYANIKNKNGNLLQEKPGDFFFEIEVLDKKSGKIHSIQLDVPDKQKYDWMYLSEVQVVNNQVKLIANCYGKNHEIRVFSFNINPLKLTDHKTIVSASGEEYSDVGILNDTFSMKPEKYVLIYKDRYEGDMYQEPRKREMVVYNMATNKLMKLDISEELNRGIEGFKIMDSILYLETYAGDRVEISRYALEKGEWLEKLSFALKPDQDRNDLNHVFTQIKNGKLFIIQLNNNDYQFSIIDLHSGKSLYEGKIKVKNQNERIKDYKMDFGNIEVLD